MKYFLLADKEITPELLADALAGDGPAGNILFNGAHSVSADRAEIQAIIDEWRDDENNGASVDCVHVLEFESDKDHETLCEEIFE